ncbi:hypothetical protein nbrc107696_30780 [Gordonia spumicola]|uniref:Uncharacterized protein n=1 Tax=Gordonia spumicola TaxID=589161 RepID=A0A7I9VBP9_9ACTN|nr:hypothetical protein nbrc107696_30780 [Gordonia spumicola]
MAPTSISERTVAACNDCTASRNSAGSVGAPEVVTAATVGRDTPQITEARRVVKAETRPIYGGV